MRARLLTPTFVVAATSSVLLGAPRAWAGDPGGQDSYANAQASGGELTVVAGHTYWTPPSDSSWATTAESDPPPGKPNPNQPYGCTYQADPEAQQTQVGIAAPSVYLHFPDLDLLLAAVVEQGFDRLTIATNAAAQDADDTAEELRARCRAYCHFALEHPRLYELMFQADLPLTLRDAPDQTPGRRSFDNLVGPVRRCLDARLAPAHDDPFRLASLIWTAEHGLVLARISRPTFPWASIDALGDDMVTRMMRFHSTGSE